MIVGEATMVMFSIVKMETEIHHTLANFHDVGGYMDGYVHSPLMESGRESRVDMSSVTVGR